MRGLKVDFEERMHKSFMRRRNGRHPYFVGGQGGSTYRPVGYRVGRDLIIKTAYAHSTPPNFK